MLAPPSSLPWKIRTIVPLHRSILILPPSSLWRKLSTLKLSFSFSLENNVFTSSSVWILYTLEDLIVFSFFCSKRYFHWPVPSSVWIHLFLLPCFSFPTRPYPVSGGWLSAARLGVQETTWDLWWIHGYCKDDFSEYFRFSLCFIPPALRNHISLIYCRYQLPSLNKHTHTLTLPPFPVSNLILPVVVYFHQFLKRICSVSFSVLLLDLSN